MGDPESASAPLDADSSMPPFQRDSDSEILLNLGIQYLQSVEVLSIFIFFYGVSSSRGTRLIHKFDNRSLCCTFLCVGRSLCVRPFCPADPLLYDQELIPRNLTGGEDSLIALEQPYL